MGRSMSMCGRDNVDMTDSRLKRGSEYHYVVLIFMHILPISTNAPSLILCTLSA